MYCRNCGNVVESDCKFCKNCGCSTDDALSKLVGAEPKCGSCNSHNIKVVEESNHVSIIKECVNALLKIVSIVLIIVGSVLFFQELSEMNATNQIIEEYLFESFPIIISGIVILAVGMLINLAFKLILGSSRTKIICVDCGQWEYAHKLHSKSRFPKRR